MAYMKDSTGQRLDSIEVVSKPVFSALRQRDLPGRNAIPTVMASPLTTALNATKQSSGRTFYAFDGLGVFSYLGGAPRRGSSSPDNLSLSNTGMYTLSSASPLTVPFEVETTDATGRFEISLKPNLARYRIAVGTPTAPDLQYLTEAGTSTGNAAGAFITVTGGAPGRYRVRLELDSNARFYGVHTYVATDTVRALTPPRRRLIVVGDSISAPTIQDSSVAYVGGQGWVQQIGMMLGVDAWSCCIGGTGYLATNSGTSVKFRDRFTEWAQYLRPGDMLWYAGGINDADMTANPSFTTAAFTTEVQTLFEYTAEQLPGVELGALSPFWPRSSSSYLTGLLAKRDAIKAAIGSVGGYFMDVLSEDITETPVVTTLTSSTAVSATGFSTAAKLPATTYFEIGTGDAKEIRRTNAEATGTGPYANTMSGSDEGLAFARAHSAGDPVRQCGPGIIRGGGNQGSPNGVGNADRYTGNDATHPTVAGHRHIAVSVFNQFAQKIAS